ncbi:putative Ig domain-containing protein [Marilutibacter penaei]|uniref:putative Ig domain-containing protein n=1 Tax=Marilutibacter penaei TaxID=2759900 RepID=UPI0015FD268E|nr:putative Ig domain-containing protein [Lysobacter penaei]
MKTLRARKGDAGGVRSRAGGTEPKSRVSHRLASAALLLLAGLGLASPATAQVMTITGASPGYYTGPGQTITFQATFGSSNAVTSAIVLQNMSRTVGPLNCAGLPLDPGGSTTCTFTYVTTASDTWGIDMFGGFTATSNGVPRSGQINRYVVPYGNTPPQAQAFAMVSSVTENGGQPLRFQVGLDKLAATPVTLNYSLGGTATAGSDYAPPSGTVTLPLGAMNWEVVINPIGDATYEPDETVVLTVTPGTGYGTGPFSSATGTIVNDDAQPLPRLTIDDVTGTEGNAGTTPFTFTVTLDAPAPAGGVSFDITTADSAARAGSDYVANTQTGMSIPAGSTSGTFTVLANGDTLNEADEAFLVNISNATGATIWDSQGRGTITNDDPLPSVSIDDTSVIEGHAGTTPVNVTVRLSAPSGQVVTVNYAGSNDTAWAGDDYVGFSGVLSFAPGQTTDTITALVNGDTVHESDETFYVTLSGPANATIADNTATVTILNDDLTPQTITFDNPGAQDFGTTPTLSASASSGLTVFFSSATPGICTITTGGALTFYSAGTCTIRAEQPGDATHAPAPVVNQSFNVDAVVPGVTIIGTATAGDGEATVTFTPPASNGGAAITSYTVISSPGAILATGAGSPLTVTGLTNGETYTFTVQASNSAGNGLASAASNAVTPSAPMSLAPTTLPGTTVGVGYSQALSVSGGVAPYSFAITAGALPAGLVLDTSGVLSGTATAGGTFNFTVTATDSVTAPAPNTGSRAYSLTVDAPLIAVQPATLATGTVGTAYTASMTASGGTAPHAFAVTAGLLPPGLSLSSGGALGGSPTAAGTFNFTVTATDNSTGSGPFTGSQAYSVSITNAVPVAHDSTTTVPYDVSGVIALDIDGVVDTVAIATAPAHGTVSLSGTTATYTPSTGFAGSDSFSFTATNDGGTSAPATVSITVGGPVISVTAGSGLAAQAGIPYTQTFTWAGGRAPFSGFQVSGLPAGLSVTATTATSATVSGTPTEAGNFGLVASAADSSTGDGPFTGTGAFTLEVSAPSLALAPGASSFNAGYDTAFSQAFTATGGVGPYSYALSGALPAGMAFSGDTLSGAPTAPGSYPITVTATDTGSTGVGAPFTVAVSYTLVVAAPTITLDPATLAAGTAGQAYAATVSAAGGTAPYTFAVSAGRLPAGVSLATDGTLSGTPTEAGSFSLTVTATDAHGQTGSQVHALEIMAPALALAPGASSFNSGYDTAFSQAFTASGGVGPYSYALGGALPAGMAFSGDTLSGAPTAPGSYPITVTATDTGSTGVGAPFTVAVSYTLVVAAPTITLDPATLATGTAGQAYAATVSATGGTAPYTFAVSAGRLPSGVSLATDGTLSGTPTEAGSFSLTVIATDAHGQTGSQVHALEIATPALDVTPGVLEAVVAGSPLNQALTIHGGIAPYSVSLTGTLPQGVQFDRDSRTFSGRPVESGTFTLTLTVTDSTTGNSATLTRRFELVVQAPALAMTPAAGDLPTAAAGVAYTQAFAAEGGIAPYGYALASGTLPAGLSFNTDGTLSGTPTEAGRFTFSVTATDATAGTAGTVTQAYALDVDAPTIAIGPDALPTATYGVDYAAVFQAEGGTAPYTFEVTGGALPAGLQLATDGTLSGTLQAAGEFSFELTATDALGFTGTRDYVLEATDRPDPTQDAEVRGLVDAQLQSARRFARAQVGNFQQRLERLHSGQRGNGVDSSVSVAMQRSCMPSLVTEPGDDCAQPIPAPAGMAPSADETPLGSQQAARGFGAWIGGSIRSGSFDGQGGSAVGFESDGLSVGFDVDLGPSFTLGAGLGYGRDDNEVGNAGSRLEGVAKALVGYGSFHPGEHWFVDGLVGYQTLDFDMRRQLTADTGTVRGQRDGDQWFGSVSVGADLGEGSLRFTPYARFDVTRGSLDAFTETGHPVLALRYEAMDVDGSTGNLGLRVDWRHRITQGWLLPQLRVEYQRELEGGGNALVRYADLASGPFYTLSPSGFDRSRFMLGLGLGFDGDGGWSTRVEYRTEAGSDDQDDHGVMLNLQKDY